MPETKGTTIKRGGAGTLPLIRGLGVRVLRSQTLRATTEKGLNASGPMLDSPAEREGLRAMKGVDIPALKRESAPQKAFVGSRAYAGVDQSSRMPRSINNASAPVAPGLEELNTGEALGPKAATTQIPVYVQEDNLLFNPSVEASTALASQVLLAVGAGAILALIIFMSAR